MSTLSQFAFACNSIVLKEVLAVMFENDNEHDFNLVIDMHTKLNDLGMRIRQRAEIILYVEKQGYATEVFETVKLLKDLQETDNAKASMQEDIQCAGSDTRPPMLDRTDFESWQQRIRLYCLGKDNGENIMKSIKEGPFYMGTVSDVITGGTEGAVQQGPVRARVGP
ncbi:hypothetical protein Tco_1063324 [Tanacetum coccineum]